MINIPRGQGKCLVQILSCRSLFELGLHILPLSDLIAQWSRGKPKVMGLIPSLVTCYPHKLPANIYLLPSWRVSGGNENYIKHT